MSDTKKEYKFGGIEEFNLEEIEEEILNESIYLDVFAGSDLRFKKNIEPLTNSVENILKLTAYKYDYKTDEYPEQNFESNSTMGVMAQEVELVYPEAVKTDDKGMKFVNYQALIPVLLGSIQDLHRMIEMQDKKIEELKKLIK